MKRFELPILESYDDPLTLSRVYAAKMPMNFFVRMLSRIPMTIWMICLIWGIGKYKSHD
jgi:hypothetical protein